MSIPNNPHDKLFKATFSEKELVIDFINNFLPVYIQEKIDVSSLSLQPTSYISPPLDEFFSDVIYSCNFGELEIQVCILFEHKSYVPPFPHLQVLRYLVEAWSQMISQEEMLKPIVPIIVYHGEDKWHHKSFESYFPQLDPTLKHFFPSFDYLLTDLSRFTDEAFKHMPIGILRQALRLLKHTRNHTDIGSFFLEIFTNLEPYSNENQYANLIFSYSVYIWGVSGLPEEDFINLVEQLPPTINKRVMTTYEQIIKKGEERGEKRGIEIARKAQQDLVLSKGFQNGLSKELLAELSGLTVPEVKSRLKELGLKK